jgi:hypothetical protein
MSLVRKQVYLHPSQEARIKRWAQAEGVAEAEIIRRTIDLGLAQLAEQGGKRSKDAALELLACIDSLIEEGPVAGQRTWSREDLYDR